jgi:hypothetical protein
MDNIFRDLTGQDNMGGIEIKLDSTPAVGSELIAARNVFSNIYNKGFAISSATNENNAGLMSFTNSGGYGSDGFQIWILYNKSYTCTMGMKIKHAGLDRIVMQGNEMHSCGRSGLQGGSYRLAFRYNVIFGGTVSLITPNADNSTGVESYGGALYEQNTFVETTGAPTYINNIQDGCQQMHGIFRNNIFAQLDSSANRIIQRLWEGNTPATSVGFQIEIDYNLYFSAHSLTDTCFTVGTWSGIAAGNKNFTTWKTINAGVGLLDINSQMADPLFASGLAGNLNITSASPAATMGSGTVPFVGAFVPDKTYGTVGASNSTLLNMNQNGDAPTDTGGGGGGGGTSYSPGDTMGIFDPTLPNATFPGQSVLAVTPSDSNSWGAVRGLYIGGAGNVAVKTFLQQGDPAVVFMGVPAGTLIPINGYIVMATGTTATSILALY